MPWTTFNKCLFKFMKDIWLFALIVMSCFSLSHFFKIVFHLNFDKISFLVSRDLRKKIFPYREINFILVLIWKKKFCY